MSMTRSEKELFMNTALEEARKGWGLTHPQPMIGAILVENGEVVAREHANNAGARCPEVRLFESLGRKPQEGASLFLTSEPGSSSNRMEAGVKAILESGIKDVLIGANDPVQEREGKAADALK